ncbi:MAG: pilus assembly protein TadG-related protein, partial [Anaerolineaceae bacterium]
MMRRTLHRKSEKGQTWVIMAVAITVLIIMLGFAVDSAVLFSNYTKLKRAVDAAAVSAANEYKVKNAKVNIDDPVSISMLVGYLTAAAKEMLVMHDLDVNKIDMHVYICDEDGDGQRDASLQTEAPALYDMCPASGQSPRKLVYVQASEEAPTYFLTLIGINSIPLTTYSISEAAPIDLVLVFDTSESMGVDTPGYITDNFDPNNIIDPNPPGLPYSCNPQPPLFLAPKYDCQPLKTAKDAAVRLVKTLFNGYDHVAVVTFDQVPTLYQGLTDDLTDDPTGVITAINKIQLHDDAPALLLNSTWYNNNLLNPGDPEDRDGDGQDADIPYCHVTPVDSHGNYDPNP